MKIIEEGTLEVKRFKCGNCGCVFEVDHTEYQSNWNRTYYSCECPCCGKYTNYEMERDEQ